VTLSRQDDARPRPAKPPIVLTIAGFDPSNGAGITADLQVFAAHGLFGVSAITALTVQSTFGVATIHPLDTDVLGQTLQILSSDLPPAGIKIGMLATAAIVAQVATFIELLSEKSGNPFTVPIVLDPVLSSSSGAPLLDPAGLEALQNTLLSRVSWVTPNWRELALLVAQPVATLEDAHHALDALGRRYPALHIVATAGDQHPPTDLLRTPAGAFHRFSGDRIDTTSTHGTGCAFSSALLSRLVLGDSPLDAVAGAKAYVTGALHHAPGLGHGRGPMDLLWTMRKSLK